MKLFYCLNDIIMILVCFSMLNCSDRKNSPRTLSKEEILLECVDKKGRLQKRIVTGWIPGEDIFLTITKFDTIGRVIEEYGAKPYGVKYKGEFKYDEQNQVIEDIVYHFQGGQNFENYKSEYELYSLSDTLADFESFESKTRIVYEYLDRKGLIRERSYLIEYDSMKRELLRLLSDTTYRSKKEEE